MKIALFIALGSGLGGVLRVLVAGSVSGYWDGGFPLGILAVNVIGSFTVGLLATLSAANGRWPLSLGPRQFLLAGFCGGFTTFSFFSMQTMELIRAGAVGLALQYSAATLVLSLAAVWLGYQIADLTVARRFSQRLLRLRSRD